VALGNKIPKQEPVTDKDLLGKTDPEQITYLENMKVKYNT